MVATVIELEIENMREGYERICSAVLREGERVSPRGQLTYEIESATIKLHDPGDALPIGIGRNLNPGIAAAEASQLVGGFSSPKLMMKVARKFGEFIDDDGRFWGAYGRRVGSQVTQVVEKLESDPDTRQAVITLWQADLDNTPGKKDYPCTLSIHLMIRGGRLNMHVTMRSNDCWLGLAYDAHQFCQLQYTIANALNIPVGLYYHHANSLHLYERDVAKLDDLHPWAGTSNPYRLGGFGVRGTPIEHSILRAQMIGKGGSQQLFGLTNTERWYADNIPKL